MFRQIINKNPHSLEYIDQYYSILKTILNHFVMERSHRIEKKTE